MANELEEPRKNDTSIGHAILVAMKAKKLSAKAKILKKKISSTRTKRSPLEGLLEHFEKMKVELYAQHCKQFGIPFVPPGASSQSAENKMDIDDPKNKPKKAEEGSKGKGMSVGNNKGHT